MSAKLRAKILKNEFIDFEALATNPTLESKYQVVLRNEFGTQPPSLALEPVNKTRKLLTISSWTSNFMVFVGVYTTVSVKMVGTLWGLLVPSMLVYKIW